jgi:hypothetical protein
MGLRNKYVRLPNRSFPGEFRFVGRGAFRLFKVSKSTDNNSQEYYQVPSRLASVGIHISVFAVPNRSDIRGDTHPGQADTRFGLSGRVAAIQNREEMVRRDQARNNHFEHRAMVQAQQTHPIIHNQATCRGEHRRAGLSGENVVYHSIILSLMTSQNKLFNTFAIKRAPFPPPTHSPRDLEASSLPQTDSLSGLCDPSCKTQMARE